MVSLTVPAAELGTPFNAEIERLQQLVAIASREGVLVSIKTETGRITLEWTSLIDGGPFNRFLGHWHLEGVLVKGKAAPGA